MERSKWTALTAGVALALAGTNGTMAFAQTVKPGPAQQAQQAQQAGQAGQAGQGGVGGQTAQTQTRTPMRKPAQAAPQTNSSPMLRPPEAASGSSGSSNPDNMPIKRPTKPTNDRMTHEPPASGANAK
jgi:hypothetical protein